MKPLQLKIKGLNSFIDEQVIDFSRLTDRGLFGIFGPTGSGKSSILDAITLALYGKAPRAGGQLSGIVNTQTDTANVVYEFALGAGNERRVYRVQRLFKRNQNRKSGNEGASTKSASLYDISDENSPQVLFEGQREVNTGVQQLIGLSAEDFTRSVVLPQGSFSEFLKMSGADRGQMLERIFALEDYGENMTARIKRLKADKHMQVVQVESLLTAYADITPEIYASREAELEQIEMQKQKQSESWLKVDEDYHKFQEVWNWQEELKLYEQIAADLGFRQMEMLSLEQSVERAEQANQIKPLIDKLEQRESLVGKKVLELKVATEQFATINTTLALTQGKWNTAWQRKELELPVCRENILNLEKAIKIKKEVDGIQIEYQALRTEYLNTTNLVDQKKQAIQGKQIQIDALKESVSGYAKQLDALKISPELREKLTQAYAEEKQYQQVLKLQQEIELQISHLEVSLQAEEAKLSSQREKCQTKELDLNSLLLEKQNLADSCPGHKDDLLNLQQEINKEQNDIDQLAEWQKDANDVHRQIVELEEQKDILTAQLAEEQKQLHQQNVMRDNCLKLLDQSRNENMAVILASHLASGEACPVCGSQHHPFPASAASKLDIGSLEKEKLFRDQEIEQQQKKVRDREIEIKNILSKQEYKERDSLMLQDKMIGRDLPELKKLAASKRDTFARLQESIRTWEEKVKDNDSRIAKLKEELTTLNTDLAAQQMAWQKDRATLFAKKEEGRQSQASVHSCQQMYRAICLELGIDQVEAKYRQMQQNDRQAEGLEKEIKTRQSLQIDLERQQFTLQEECNKLELGRAEIETSGKEKRQVLDQKCSELQAVCGELSPESMLAAQKKTIADIEANYQVWNERYELEKKHQDELKQQVSSLDGDLRSLEKVLEQERIELAQELCLRGFHEIAEVLACFQEESKIIQSKASLRDYHDSCQVNKANIQRIELKLNGLKITDTDWQQLQLNRLSLHEKLEKLSKQLLLMEAAQKEMGVRLQTRQELEKKKAAINQDYGLIEELETLFKGKKFVDFIARTQLSYIAREASIKLKDITRGRYALELSAEGDFIMRDDFNGGVRRATHTLSGGETFLTSLALALALSTHIQLGRASLEFFFLDEGFGTLDAETLETVMESLESLHSEQLTVGVISHVEELKQRVPRKLIVTQAIPGISGSTVSIE